MVSHHKFKGKRWHTTNIWYKIHRRSLHIRKPKASFGKYTSVRTKKMLYKMKEKEFYEWQNTNVKWMKADEQV